MKNFKLLLATTAILSTGLAMGVLADDETPTINIQQATAQLNAEVQIYSSFNLGDGYINFGSMTNAGGKKIKIDQFGNVDETVSDAQYLGGAYTAPITVTGGSLTAFYNSRASSWQAIINDSEASDEAKAAAQAEFDSFSARNTNSLYIELGSNGVIAMEDSDHDPCGKTTVSAPVTRYTINAEDKGEVAFYYGGTFEMDDDYEVPEDGKGICSGSITATLFVESF